MDSITPRAHPPPALEARLTDSALLSRYVLVWHCEVNISVLTDCMFALRRCACAGVCSGTDAGLNGLRKSSVKGLTPVSVEGVVQHRFVLDSSNGDLRSK